MWNEHWRRNEEEEGCKEEEGKEDKEEVERMMSGWEMMRRV